jgi:class 3 adenylate cyclase
MQCLRCHHDHPPDAAFCDECGARLEIVCASCGEVNRPGAKFCRKCGHRAIHDDAPGAAASSLLRAPESYTPQHLAEKILTSKAALEGERKQVTVLFADLKGSMELLADRDPEEARNLLDPVLERMMEAVHRYEGTVNQIMGDGIMALFGAPLAHEDHAVRACYAAHDMQAAMRRYTEEVRHAHGIEVQIRVGLNSGEVVVRTIGSDLRMDYTAVGQTTHLAARMEQLAPPGTIRLTTETLHLAEGYIEVKPLGPVPVKGLDTPVDVIGQNVSFPVLQAIVGAAEEELRAALGRLQAAEFLYEAAIFPDSEYMFKHALTHDVAYGSLLHERRRRLHVQIAEAIERLHADRLAEHIDQLAHHAFLGEAWEKAFTYAREAGIKAFAHSANRRMALAYEQALAALAHLPPSFERVSESIDLRFALRNALIPLGEIEPVHTHLTEATRLAESLGDQARHAKAHNFLSNYFWFVGDPSASVASARRARVVAAPDDFAIEVTSNHRLGAAYHALGDYNESVRILSLNVEALRDFSLERFGLAVSVLAISRYHLVLCHCELGDFPRAFAHATDALRGAERPHERLFAHHALAWLHLARGEWRDAPGRRSQRPRPDPRRRVSDLCPVSRVGARLRQGVFGRGRRDPSPQASSGGFRPPGLQARSGASSRLVGRGLPAAC